MVAKKKKTSAALTSEIIVAPITPPGEGGIAALRLAGEDCLDLFLPHFKSGHNTKGHPLKQFHLRYGYFVTSAGEIIDEITAVFMPKDRSYTGLPQIEIFCHGGRQIVKAIQQELIAAGARAAEPGEFTKLAFLAGRIDLTRAEAVAEVIAANTDTSFRAARDHLLGTYHAVIDRIRESAIDVIAEVEASIDYPEEEIDTAEKISLLDRIDAIIADINELTSTYRGGRIISEGFRVAIGGRPNAGKSSLFNLFLRQQRALVTPTAGTTRDYLSEWIDLEGFKVNITDTAGIRKAGGTIEKAGQESALAVIGQSDLLLWMFDCTTRKWRTQLTADLGPFSETETIVIANKVDLISARLKTKPELGSFISISCKTGQGIDRLKQLVVDTINVGMPDLTAGAVVTSARHKQKLEQAAASFLVARQKIHNGETPELTAFDLREGIGAIDEITGRIYNEDILGRIFSKFCIGK